jgi:hypothetical protein
MSQAQPHPLHAASTFDAEEASRVVREAGRWFSGYLALLGALAAVWIFTLEAVFPTGTARWVALAWWPLAVIAASRWAENHHVHPRGARPRLMLASILWFGNYVVLVGPLVRWQAGTSPTWWALASLLLASPYFVVAWRYRRAA